MPFETVNEQVVRERRVRVCARCRRQLPEVVQHRGAYQTGGSIAGSLGGSVGGSMLAGAVLGPVGAIAGAIGGAVAGSRAGAAASGGICDAAEYAADDLCPDCKSTPSRPTGQKQWGGGRLGDGSSGSQPAPAPAAVEPTASERMSGAWSSVGDRFNQSTEGARQWWTGGASQSESKTSSSKGGKSGGFETFSGSGHTLGHSESQVRPQSRLVAVEQRAVAPPRPQQQAFASPPLSQEEQDAALARQLQEQFYNEDRRGR
mmetsp:Transcript_13761/g.37668  ORF Transcript_13761/g.37668 Transcript_13761/m.37668 type:complete len:260 (-) Transcript_13761:114-893(-)